MSGLSASDQTAGLKFSEVLNSKSLVWKHFLKDATGKYAKCKIRECSSLLKLCGATTSCLHTHLKTKHNIVLTTTRPAPQVPATTVNQPKISGFVFRQDTTEIVVARMAAKDGIPFLKFCTSLDIRKGIQARRLEGELPKSANGIRNLVMKFGQRIKDHYKSRITKLRGEGHKFCAVFDEWTSLRRRRYMNVTLISDHSELFNLGLVALRGSVTSKYLLDSVVTKLNEFGISFGSDIISIGTDGTTVMTCLGKMSPTHQQLCFAHAVQLAVIDILYPKNKKAAVNKIEMDTTAGNEEMDTAEKSQEEMDAEGEEDEFQLDYFGSADTEDVSHVHYRELISKARRIVKIFREPKKNEVLQKHVVADFKEHELELILDTKTRWNSLYSMLERLCKLRNCVKKALIDLKSDVQFEDWELDHLDDLVKALEPLKITVEALCRQDFDLLQADQSLNFALSKLDTANSEISVELAAALRTRIAQRRTEASEILQYLHRGNAAYTDDSFDGIFQKPKKGKMAEALKRLLLRLNPELDSQPAILSEEAQAEPEIVLLDDVQPAAKKSKKNPLQEELELALDKVKEGNTPGKTKITATTLLTTIKQELKLFDSNGFRGYHLELAYGYLKAIVPTSVESERAFSASGYLCNKIRSRLSDDVLNTLCILRSYFQITESP